MIYVECKPDGILVRHLTGLPKRQVAHEARGRGAVCNRLKNDNNVAAMVDEDPGTARPIYLTDLALSNENVQLGLNLYRDRSRNNRVVALYPKLEDWLLRAAADSDLSMNDYGLPNRANELHSVINLDERKIQRLLADLYAARSPRLLELRRLLTA